MAVGPALGEEGDQDIDLGSGMLLGPREVELMPIASSANGSVITM